MKRRLSAPAEALLTGAAFVAWILFGFGILGWAISLARAAAGLGADAVHWDPGTPVEMIGWFVAIGVVSASASSAHRLLRQSLRATSIWAAAIGSVAALVFSVQDGSCWPFCEAVQLGGLEWLVPVISTAVIGVLLGLAVAGTRLGSRYLWIPVAEIAAGGAWLWLVFVPVMRLTIG